MSTEGTMTRMRERLNSGLNVMICPLPYGAAVAGTLKDAGDGARERTERVSRGERLAYFEENGERVSCIVSREEVAELLRLGATEIAG